MIQHITGGHVLDYFLAGGIDFLESSCHCEVAKQLLVVVFFAFRESQDSRVPMFLVFKLN